MRVFYEKCIKRGKIQSSSQVEGCRMEALRAAGVNSAQVSECMRESFDSKAQPQTSADNSYGLDYNYLSDNHLLKYESAKKRSLGLQYYPSVVINGEIYRVSQLYTFSNLPGEPKQRLDKTGGLRGVHKGHQAGRLFQARAHRFGVRVLRDDPHCGGGARYFRPRDDLRV
jgi:hypothetical protein